MQGGAFRASVCVFACRRLPLRVEAVFPAPRVCSAAATLRSLCLSLALGQARLRLDGSPRGLGACALLSRAVFARGRVERPCCERSAAQRLLRGEPGVLEARMHAELCLAGAEAAAAGARHGLGSSSSSRPGRLGRLASSEGSPGFSFSAEGSRKLRGGASSAHRGLFFADSCAPEASQRVEGCGWGAVASGGTGSVCRGVSVQEAGLQREGLGVHRIISIRGYRRT